MTDFAWDYFKLAFWTVTGVVQIASAYSGLRGLWFVPSRRMTPVMGAVMVIAAFVWFFFLSGPRNLPDTTFGLDGNEQVMLFAAGGIVGIVVSLLFSSLRNLVLGRDDEREYAGFEALKHMSFARAMLMTLRKLWKLCLSRFGAPTPR